MFQSPTRLKEQVAGRLAHYWKDDLRGGKSKTRAVFLDGQNFQNVLIAGAWSDADQVHAENHLKPHLGQVVALENSNIVSKGKATVFHGNHTNMSYGKLTVVNKLDNKEEYSKALPHSTIAQCAKLPSLCAISLVVRIQEVSGPHNRPTDGGDEPVSNLQVAFEDRKIDTAFWGHQLADAMGQSKKCDVYRLDWISLVPLGNNLFKLVSNSGTEVEQVHGTDAENVRGAVTDTLVSMTPQFGLSRSEKIKLPASRVSLSWVSHIRAADIRQDNTNAYKGAVIGPCCFLKELRSLSDSIRGLPYDDGCPQCKKATKRDSTCPDHGTVTANKVVGAAVALQDPCTTLDATLWNDSFEALRSEFGVGPEVADTEVLPLLAQHISACQLVDRMGVGINKSGNTHDVDLFVLAPAVSAEGALAAFHNLLSLPGHDSDGLVPLCCQHLHPDSMGQLQAKFESQTRLIGGAMCMFRVRAEPEPTIMQDIDGLMAKVQAR